MTPARAEIGRTVASVWPSGVHGWHPFGLAAGLPASAVFGVGATVLAVAIVVAAGLGRRAGRRSLAQRLTALGSRLGIDAPDEGTNVETSLAYLEQVTGSAAEAVADSSAAAIRLRRSLDTFSQGVVLCDENGHVVYRNARADALMVSRHGEALAAQAVTELLEDAWDNGSAERTLDLYGPPRRTLTVRARQIDDGRRPLGVVAMIEDVSERRRLEDIRRDFVANVSHELKTPMGALGLLAETLVAEPDLEVGRRLASRIHTEAFRVSRIIDDLLDLSRIESEEAPPREPVLVSLVMAEAAERVRASADQRGITISITEPDKPVAVLGDRRQLVSAMHALIENAVTYSYEGSTVAVTAEVVQAGTDAEAGLMPAESSGGTPNARTVAPVSASSAAHQAVTQAPIVNASLPTPARHAQAAAPVSPSNESRPKAGTNGGSPTPSTSPGSTSHQGQGGGAGQQGRAGNGVSNRESPASAGDAGNGANGSEPVDRAAARAPTTAGTAPEPSRATASRSSGTTATSEVRTGDATGRRTPRQVVRVSVVDQGIGIPARDLDRIFERFYRVDQGRSRHTGGTGLGLSIVRHVASNHQGWVEVQSREGEGSTFTLVLQTQPERPDARSELRS